MLDRHYAILGNGLKMPTVKPMTTASYLRN